MRHLLPYARERLLAPRVVMAAVLVCGTAAMLGTARPLFGDLLLSFALVCQFRIWDDLADRRSDSHRHPKRVLSTAHSSSPFVAVTVAIGAVILASVITSGGPAASVALLVTLWIVFAAWYGARGNRTARRDHLLLLKYPAFAAILCGPSRVVTAPAGWLTLTVLYLAVCVYEAWHDLEAPRRVHRMAVEAPLLGVAVTALAFIVGGQS
ncbi:MAG: hypothetical protein LC753_15995 [Acidobacteria bacterium]|nr:hypothetical protein [Acidobacteriota bacterium]MCA1651703.1 hypothetical protein [Acidobacteriota bacterium]